METFENIAVGFVGLAIASLVWIVIGFALHSTVGQNIEIDEDAPQSKASHLVYGFVWLLLAVGWAYRSWMMYYGETRDWLWIAIATAASLMALAVSVRSFRDAKQAT